MKPIAEGIIWACYDFFYSFSFSRNVVGNEQKRDSHFRGSKATAKNVLQAILNTFIQMGKVEGERKVRLVRPIEWQRKAVRNYYFQGAWTSRHEPVLEMRGQCSFEWVKSHHKWSSTGRRGMGISMTYRFTDQNSFALPLQLNLILNLLADLNADKGIIWRINWKRNK